MSEASAVQERQDLRSGDARLDAAKTLDKTNGTKGKERPKMPAMKACVETDGEVETGRWWTSCARGLRGGGALRTELDKLTLLCGPASGMRAYTGVWTGKVLSRVEGTTWGGKRQIDEGWSCRTWRIDARGGRCYRGFVVGNDHAVAVSVEQPEEACRVQEVRLAEGWAMVPNEGPVCFRRRQPVVVRVCGRAGWKVAAQVWSLPL